jgi:transcriptional regulator with XRE-family HTH domain
LDTSTQPTQLTRLGRLFRDQRNRQGVSQARAAKEVGAKQSQISGFENGRPVLSQEKVRRLAGFLEIDLAHALAPLSDEPATAPGLARTLAYCVAVECPGNLPYFVQGRGFYRPTFVELPAAAPGSAAHGASADRAERCRWCGEQLETRCVHCDAPLTPGLCCPTCGQAYVESDEELFTGEPDVIRRRCEAIRVEKCQLLDVGAGR